MSSSTTYVTAAKLNSTGYAMIVLTSIFCLTRFGLRFWKLRSFQIEDLFVLLAWIFFLGLTISYLVLVPVMYRVLAVEDGQAPLYPTLEKDALEMIKIFFTNSMLLWATLWSVKISLLLLYRRLMIGLPRQMRWWWAVLVFTILTFIGAVISNFTSCSSMHAWFTVGLCEEPRDVVAQIASLYYSFAVDVITDLMIMVLPIGLIWNLQMPLNQKLGIGGIFCVGFICIIVAVIRVVQIGVESNNNSMPSSQWLALWGIIETAIAVVVSCLPSFAVMYRSHRAGRSGYPYAADGSGGYTPGPSRNSRMRHEAIMLKNSPSSNTSSTGSHNLKELKNGVHTVSVWGETHSSQEHLADESARAGAGEAPVSPGLGGILVTSRFETRKEGDEEEV